MKTAIIWNISDGQKFPFDIWRNFKIEIRLNHVNINDYKSIRYSDNELNMIFLNVSPGKWEEIKKEFYENVLQIENVFMALVALPSSHIPQDPAIPFKFYFIDTPIKQRELKTIIDKSLKSEFYKQAAIEISNNCKGNFEVFQGVFELARNEQKNSMDTIKAFQQLFDYENKVKKFYNDLGAAIERVNELKEHEIIELKELIKANEQLDILREKELKDALLIKDATEKALHFSRIEEINMDKIIRAQQKLFKYSDKEVLALYNENIELKKKLGIPVEE